MNLEGTVPPGYRSETVAHEGEEILYVLEGSITQRLDGDEMVMSAGDSLHFRGNRRETELALLTTPAGMRALTVGMQGRFGNAIED